MSARQRIVFVGGGPSTVDAYAVLVRRCRRAIRQGRLEVVVVNPHDHLSLPGFVRDVVTETVPLAAIRMPLRVAMPLAVVVPAMVTHVDRSRRIVTYARVSAAGSGSVEALRYDELVVEADRAEPAPLPGLTEHGFVMRGSGDLGRLVARLRLLEDADAARRPADLLVVHAGQDSVDLAAALAARRTTAVRRVHLVPGTDRPGALENHRRRDLERLGVVVHPGAHLVGVGRRHVTLSDGSILPTGLVLATGRPRSVALPGLESLPGPDRLALALAPGVWATGDGLGEQLVEAVAGRPASALRLAVPAWTALSRHRIGALAGGTAMSLAASGGPSVMTPPRYAAVSTTRRPGAARAVAPSAPQAA